MPILGEEDFRKALKKNTPTGLICLFGEDLYLKDFYLHKIVSQVVPDTLAMFNLHTFVRDESPLEAILDAIDAMPMMSEKQCVLVRDYPIPDLNKDDTEVFEAALRNLPETTVLLFVFSAPDIAYTPGRPDKWTKVIAMLAKYGTAVNLAHRSPEAVAKTLVSGAKERGTSIGADEAKYLIERAGIDLQTLFHEFNKLCAYANGAPITNEMIDACVVRTVDAFVFDISRFLLNGQPDRAFDILHELLRQKTDSTSIIGALAYTWAAMYRVKVMQAEGESLKGLSELYGYKTLTNAVADANNHTLRQIKESLDILADADSRSKSRAVIPQILLEETFARLSAVYRETPC